MVSFRFVVLLASFFFCVHSLTTYKHDDSFIPDGVLRISRGNVSIGGIQRYTTLVNGTVPGPVLRLKEGETVWVRVYNDMTDQNATMVGDASALEIQCADGV